jgi:hypothetical protein
MKKRLFIIYAILLIGINKINAQTGSISGNVYWKYNNYVGNRPDAGSEIVLIQLTHPAIQHKAKCDIQGNYKIEGIIPGRYFLQIKSQNTKQDPIFYTRLFKIFKDNLDSAYEIKVSNFRNDLQNEIDVLYEQQVELNKRMRQMKYAAYRKENDKIEKELHIKIKDWIESMPIEIKNKLGIYSYIHESLDYEVLEIKENKNETVVTDFGITYL